MAVLALWYGKSEWYHQVIPIGQLSLRETSHTHILTNTVSSAFWLGHLPIVWNRK